VRHLLYSLGLSLLARTAYTIHGNLFSGTETKSLEDLIGMGITLSSLNASDGNTNSGEAVLKSVLLTLMLGLFPLQLLAEETPNDVVAEAANLLDNQLKTRKEELGKNTPALYAMVDEILLPRLDRKLAARLVLGRHWRTANDTQKTRFIDAFYTTLVHRYADGILDFDLSKMKVLPHRSYDESSKKTVVKTTIQLDDGTVTPVNYRMVHRPVGWQVYDIVIEGISYIRNFRTEINSEIGTSSLDAVVGRLEAEAKADTPEQSATPGLTE